MFIKKFIGDRKFYRRVIAISFPIMVQTGITNFVNLLDNIMVGRLGTESMSGVSIVNQFIFIFNLLIFGAISAAGIFTAQYHGNNDAEGEKYTFRFKFIINIIAAIIGIAVFALFDDALISLFLHSSGTEGNLALTLEYGKSYLRIMLIGLIPYTLSQVYASTMRETGETVMPMIASVIAVITNFVLNYILIFGKLGFAPLGAEGAAIATVISRFGELAILLIWGHTHTKKCPYLIGAYRSIRIPKALFVSIAIRGLPLMLNELFWSLAVTLRNQCYSTRGLEVVAAQNISSTIFNLFSVAYMAIGSAVAIIVGNELGAGRLDEAKATAKKMLAFSVTCSILMGGIMVAFSTLFPSFYNTTEGVRTLATYMIIVSALTMPFCACAHSSYFTIRSGGKILVTILFDSVYMWVLVLPLSFGLSYFTNINIHLLFAICQCTEMIKATLGLAVLKKGSWVRQLVGNDNLKK